MAIARRRTGSPVFDQRCVDDVVRDGVGSGKQAVLAPAGESAYLECATGRMPVLDELQVRLWAGPTVRAYGWRFELSCRAASTAPHMPQTTLCAVRHVNKSAVGSN